MQREHIILLESQIVEIEAFYHHVLIHTLSWDEVSVSKSLKMVGFSTPCTIVKHLATLKIENLSESPDEILRFYADRLARNQEKVSSVQKNNFRKRKIKARKLKIKAEPSTSEPKKEAECARHIPYDGMRKEKDWFSFYTHKYRVPVLKRCGVPACGSNMPEYNRSLYRWLSKAPLLYCKKSSVHKVGIFAGQPIEQGQFVAEYVGVVIRNCLLERREKFYRDKNLGTYMFKLDENFTIDSTLKGCIARFINHSCIPNCYAKIIDYMGRKRIVLGALRNIRKDEELFYDYKMPKEKDKIPCLCRTKSCRKYLN